MVSVFNTASNNGEYKFHFFLFDSKMIGTHRGFVCVFSISLSINSIYLFINNTHTHTQKMLVQTSYCFF